MDIELKSLDGLTTHATATSIFVQPKHFLTYEKALSMFGKDSSATKESILESIRSANQAKL